jgi:hypothetical protein
MSEEPQQGPGLARALVGSWQLVAWEISYPATGRVTEPFAPDAAGLLLYADDGYMSVVMRKAARASGAPASEVDQAQGFKSYVHYAGTWRVEDREVVHDLQHALHPALQDTVQRRRVTLRGAELELTGEERQGATGAVRVHRVLWRRAG